MIRIGKLIEVADVVRQSTKSRAVFIQRAIDTSRLSIKAGLDTKLAIFQTGWNRHSDQNQNYSRNGHRGNQAATRIADAAKSIRRSGNRAIQFSPKPQHKNRNRNCYPLQAPGGRLSSS